MIVARVKVPTESAEQIKVVNRVRHFYPGVLIYAVPNGGGRSAQEATRLKEEGVLAGVPDLFVAEARGGYFGLYVEMKRRTGGRTSDEQDDVMGTLSERGYKAVVCLGADEAWEVVKSYMSRQETVGWY